MTAPCWSSFRAGRRHQHTAFGHTGPTSLLPGTHHCGAPLLFLARLIHPPPSFSWQQLLPCPGRVVSPETSLCPPATIKSIPAEVNPLRTTPQMYPRPLSSLWGCPSAAFFTPSWCCSLKPHFPTLPSMLQQESACLLLLLFFNYYSVHLLHRLPVILTCLSIRSRPSLGSGAPHHLTLSISETRGNRQAQRLKEWHSPRTLSHKPIRIKMGRDDK